MVFRACSYAAIACEMSVRTSDGATTGCRILIGYGQRRSWLFGGYQFQHGNLYRLDCLDSSRIPSSWRFVDGQYTHLGLFDFVGNDMGRLGRCGGDDRCDSNAGITDRGRYFGLVSLAMRRRALLRSLSTGFLPTAGSAP